VRLGHSLSNGELVAIKVIRLTALAKRSISKLVRDSSLVEAG